MTAKHVSFSDKPLVEQILLTYEIVTQEGRISQEDLQKKVGLPRQELVKVVGANNLFKKYAFARQGLNPLCSSEVFYVAIKLPAEQVKEFAEIYAKQRAQYLC